MLPVTGNSPPEDASLHKSLPTGSPEKIRKKWSNLIKPVYSTVTHDPLYDLHIIFEAALAQAS